MTDLASLGLDERRLGWTKKVFDKYVEPSGHISLHDFSAICHMVDERLVPEVVERTFETAGAVDGRIDQRGFSMWVGLMFGYVEDEEFDEVMGELHDPDSILGPMEPPITPGGTAEIPTKEVSPKAKLTQEVESLRQMNLVKDARIEALETKMASMEHSYNTLLEVPFLPHLPRHAAASNTRSPIALLIPGSPQKQIEPEPRREALEHPGRA